VVCYTTWPHQVALGLAGLAILVVIIGYPLALLLWIIPEVHRTVMASPAATRLRASLEMLKRSKQAEADAGVSGECCSVLLCCCGCCMPMAPERDVMTSAPFAHNTANVSIRRIKRSYVQDQD